MPETRYQLALKRNIDEVLRAILLRAYNAIIEQEIYGRVIVLLSSANALFNDLIARAIKVLDKGRSSSTFWYLYNYRRNDIDKLLENSGSSIASIDTLASKLKIVRNKTHFHIDKRDVMSPKAVWERAAIQGDELKNGLIILYDVLKALHYEEFHSDGFPLEYDADDVHRIQLAVRNACFNSIRRD